MNKHLLFNLFASLGGDILCRVFHRTPVVLFYHGVGEDPDPIIERESISVSDFRRQLLYLKQHYNVISINEFEQHYEEKCWEGREVILTFDDGYSNMLSTALPILEEFAMPFTVFLTTNNISTGDLFPTSLNRLVLLASSLKHLELPSCNISVDLTPKNRPMVAVEISNYLKSRPLQKVRIITDELRENISEEEICDLRYRYKSVNPLNWSEVKILSESSLCTIGSHCVDHICCHENQDSQEVNRQIGESKTVIEDKLGISCRYFSYPNGNYTDKSNAIVKKSGYRFGFSTRRKPISALTKWSIPRMYVPYDYSRFVYSLVTYPSND